MPCRPSTRRSGGRSATQQQTVATPAGIAWRRALKQANRSDNYARDFAESFATDRVAEVARELGRPVDDLDPRKLPTFWSSALIHVARIRAVIIGGTSPTGRSSAGQIDLLHLEEAASYADVLVTCDRALRAFAAGVRDLRCHVVSFEQWAKALAG